MRLTQSVLFLVLLAVLAPGESFACRSGGCGKRRGGGGFAFSFSLSIRSFGGGGGGNHCGGGGCSAPQPIGYGGGFRRSFQASWHGHGVRGCGYAGRQGHSRCSRGQRYLSINGQFGFAGGGYAGGGYGGGYGGAVATPYGGGYSPAYAAGAGIGGAPVAGGRFTAGGFRSM